MCSRVSDRLLRCGSNVPPVYFLQVSSSFACWCASLKPATKRWWNIPGDQSQASLSVSRQLACPLALRAHSARNSSPTLQDAGPSRKKSASWPCVSEPHFRGSHLPNLPPLDFCELGPGFVGIANTPTAGADRRRGGESLRTTELRSIGSLVGSVTGLPVMISKLAQSADFPLSRYRWQPS